MELRALFHDQDAVSPVIGVILMVAITVILAAVIGAFVLGIGGSQEAAPQATIEYDFQANNNDGFGDGGTPAVDGDAIQLQHSGGESFEAGQLSASIGSGSSGASINDLTTTGGLVSSTSWGSGTSAGDTITFTETGSGGSNIFAPGEDITITWTAESGDSAQILSESTVP